MKTASSTVWISVSLFLNFAAIAAKAQIVPDSTLPENSRVEAGCTDCTIEGGTTRDSNLFHSFREFSIPTGGSAAFNHSPQIQNIFTRVTGNSVSNIDGLLRSLHTANLFLLNPNGVIFGANARLDVGGAFVASTADAIAFPNGEVFSATNPTAPTPLLTVNPNALLFNQLNPQPILSQGATLQVPNGQTLNLIGGNVEIDGGRLLARGGRVELAGVAAAGEVGLMQQGQDWRLRVPDGLARADVAIGNDAIVDVRSGGGGSIAITARNFTSTGARTRIGAGIAAGLGTVDAQAGDVDINATEAINLDEMAILNQVARGGTGNAGNINITTDTLSFTKGGEVIASTTGRGNAGNITITARDAVSIDGVGSTGFLSGAFTSVDLGAIGQGGNVSITTGRLAITNGGVVNAVAVGQGNAGNITITARDAVSIDGVGNRTNSGAASQVGPGVIGQGGNVSITTGRLSLTNGGIVTASTFGQGNAGNVTITARDAVFVDGVGNGFNSGAYSQVARGSIGQGGNVSITTSTLSLTNGGTLGVATFGQGNAGNITITARNRMSFDGVGNGFNSGAYSLVNPGAIGRGGNVSITTGTLSLTNGGVVTASTSGQGNAGNITITARDAVSFDGMGNDGSSSGAVSQVASRGIGQGGTIAIDTGLFSITNGAGLSASSEGRGGAGDLEVVARQLRLDNEGSIEAQTTSGQGGNMRLQIQDLLLMRRDSSISTTAGTDQAGGDGGNITFNGGFLVAVPSENSDITANAFTGRGGNVEIIAQGIYGFELGSRLTPQSDITASSQFGTQGTIVLNVPNADPTQGIIELPADVVDASNQIAVGCSPTSTAQVNRGEFYETGRGGIAPSPTDPIASADILEDLQPPASWSASTEPPAEIVEAQSWQVNDRGEVMLVATTLPNHCGH